MCAKNSIPGDDSVRSRACLHGNRCSGCQHREHANCDTFVELSNEPTEGVCNAADVNQGRRYNLIWRDTATGLVRRCRNGNFITKPRRRRRIIRREWPIGRFSWIVQLARDERYVYTPDGELLARTMTREMRLQASVNFGFL